MSAFQDGHGRRLEYLRLSVTQRCNFRCAYCLPDGCAEAPGPAPLSVPEIERLVRAFAALGVWKVRLTGGEPAIRSDLAEIVRRVAATPGVRRVGLTTNGYRLARGVAELRAAGLSSLNVSVDSLDPARFARLTGYPRLERIVAGVEAAVAAGFPSIKVNAVLLRGLDDAELGRFLDWTRGQPLTVRFIELMRTGDNAAFFEEQHVPADALREKLEARGWAELPRDANDGPATNYGHPAHRGRVGIIAPYTPGFCEACNRVRASATGDLQLCLFGERAIPLRRYLQADADREELMRVIAAATLAKPASHRLHQGASGATRNLAVIGG